jgi:membrane protein
VNDFLENDALTHAAALAYYTALGLSPVLVLMLWLATVVGDGTREELVTQMQALVGPEGGQAIRVIIENAAAKPSLGSFAGIGSLVMLLFSVSGVFAQQQYALNRLWHVKVAPERSTWRMWIRKRLLSIGTFVSAAFLLIVSLAVSAAVAVAGRYARHLLPGGDLLGEVFTAVMSLAVAALVFGLVFKVLPDVKLGWRDVAVGGMVTAILFSIGRYLIGIYLGQSSVGSAYGAAGSLVVLLVWVYYAALVVFLGAEVTRVLAYRRRGFVQPEDHAVPLDEHKAAPGEPHPAGV